MVKDTVRQFEKTQSEPVPSGGAWLPLSFSGVAAFAQASRVRLWIVQLAAAVCCSACLFWFLQTAWMPVVEKALMELPEQGGIQEGILRWGGEPNQVLDYNNFLSLSVIVDGGGESQAVSDLGVVFDRSGIEMTTLLGRLKLPYGRAWRLSLTRKDLEPWWLAWQPVLAVLGFGAFASLLLVAWTLVSVLYALPAGLWAGLLGRNATWSGVRRLSGAALVPGGLFLSLAFLFYGAGRFDFIGLLFAFALHWVIGWVYVLGGILRLPAGSTTRKGSSPFDEPPPSSSPKLRRSKNPFQTR